MRKIRSTALGYLSRAKQCFLRKSNKFCYKTELISLLHELPVTLYFCIYFSKQMTVFLGCVRHRGFSIDQSTFSVVKSQKATFWAETKKLWKSLRAASVLHIVQWVAPAAVFMWSHLGHSYGRHSMWLVRNTQCSVSFNGQHDNKAPSIQTPLYRTTGFSFIPLTIPLSSQKAAI